LVAALIVIIFMIKSTLESALVKKNLQSVYIKILMNHLQLILLTASFNFDWPDNVTDFYDTTKPASQVSSQILSFDCFLDQRSNDNDSNLIPIFYQKMIMYAVVPVVMVIVCTLFWNIFVSYLLIQQLTIV
jgi:hypothetical protein